jgi:hypothetical protein
MIGIYFDGRRLIRPQAATRIDDTGMYARGLGGANTLALIGECSGGEPGKVMWFTDPSYAKAILRSGDLLTAIQRAYAPSSEVNGAYLVAAIRVNPATKATLTLRDVSGNPLILVSSIDWGLWNNQIKVRVEDGTLPKGGKKLTITYGNTYDQGDNILKKSLVVGLSDALALSGTLSIGGGNLTTLVTASPQAVYFNATPETTPFSLKVNLTDKIYVGSDIKFSDIGLAISVANNAGASKLILKYGDGSGFVAIPGWVGDGTDDHTMDSGVTLAVPGKLSFAIPTGWLKTTHEGVEAYWVEITSDTDLSSTDTAATSVTLYRGISISLADYPTIQQLSDYIDSLPGYEADVITTSPDFDSSEELDDVVDGDFFAALKYIATLNVEYDPTDSTNSRILQIVSSTGDIAIGDYVTISRADGSAEEMRKVTKISPVTIDSALSTTYPSGSVVREATVFNSDLQALIDWINVGNTAYVEAAYHTSAVNRAALANHPDAYLSGGAEYDPDTNPLGATRQEDWDAALDLLKTEDTPLISCVSYEPSVWASLEAHCIYMSTVGKKERRGFCGGFDVSFNALNPGLGKWNGYIHTLSSIEQMLTYAMELNSDRMCYVGPGFKAYDENGILVTYNGAIAAALVAGMAAGVDVATALTHVSINVIGLEHNFQWGDLDRLLEGGVLPLEYDPGRGYRVCQSISTWLRNDKYNRRELSVGRTADFIARQVRERLEMDFVGKKGTITTLISIKNAVISVLTQMYRADLLAGDAANPPFKNIQCRLEGDTCWVDFECSPVIPINYIPITIHLTVFTTTLTA